MQKKDEALAMQNKVAAERAIYDIENTYGPFSQEEINHYKKSLTVGGSNIINKLTNELLGYVFYKNLGDPETWKSLPNTEHYIKLIISAKRFLTLSGFIMMPYMISARVTKVSTRKVINKSNTNEIKNSPLWEQFRYKYNNEKIEQQFMDLLGTVKSSSFKMIEWDNDKCCPSVNDGIDMPMIDDLIDEELLKYAILI